VKSSFLVVGRISSAQESPSPYYFYFVEMLIGLVIWVSKREESQKKITCVKYTRATHTHTNRAKEKAKKRGRKNRCAPFAPKFFFRSGLAVLFLSHAKDSLGTRLSPDPVP
jgi:hypothetical protein